MFDALRPKSSLLPAGLRPGSQLDCAFRAGYLGLSPWRRPGATPWSL